MTVSCFLFWKKMFFKEVIVMNQFIESLRRLYKDNKVSKETVIKLCNDGKITKEQELYILAL